MADATKNFLGSGWKFPVRLDLQGRIELVHQEQDIEEAIQMILRTNQGERPMRPEFGSELFQLVFAPNDAATAGLARRYVQESLARWEPRIEVMEVEAGPALERDAETGGRGGRPAARPNVLSLHILYRIRATNSVRNLVFPFYTIPGEDE